MADNMSIIAIEMLDRYSHILNSKYGSLGFVLHHLGH